MHLDVAMDKKSKNFNDVLLSHIREGNFAKVQSMFQNQNLCDYKDESGKTLLHFAAECGNERATQYLITWDCQVNATDDLGNTPLILAAKSRNLSVVYVLLEANASNVLVPNHLGENTAEIIVRDLRCNFVLLMSKLLEKVKQECGNDSLTTAKKLLEMRCSLSQAVCARDTIITEYMLENGCCVNESSDEDGLTPLHQAVRSTDLNNVELLLDRGADVDAEMIRPRERPVHQVRWHEAGGEDVFKALLERRCDLTDENGQVHVGQHLQCGDEETVNLLLQCLPNLDVKDHLGSPLLRYLAGNQHFDPVEELKGRTLDVNATSADGSTSLMAAVYQNNVRTVEWLLANGALVDVSNEREERALDFAFDNSEALKMIPRLDGRLRSIELLLQHGADVQWTDDFGDTIFHLAVGIREFELIKPVLAHLAMIEALGSAVKDFVSARIESHVTLRKYFATCKRAIERMRRTEIRRGTTLFDVLTRSEEEIMKLTRSEKSAAILKTMVDVRKRRSKLYYYKFLRRRLARVVEFASLRSKALSLVLRIEEICGNVIVAEKIVDCFSYDDLTVVALV